MAYSLVEAVRAMRKAQKRYFQSRSPVALADAKALEKQVDDLLAAHDQAEQTQVGLPLEGEVSRG